ncbi:MAG: hypothetical protein RR847_01840 [Bacilli bacterium]
MLTILDEFNRIGRKVSDFISKYYDNPIFWLGTFLFGLLCFKLVWDALSKEK